MGNSDQAGKAQAMQIVTMALLASLQAKRPHHLLLRRGAFLLTFILLIVAGIWAGGNIYGVRYELQNSLIPARSSEAQLKKTLEQKASVYRLEIVRPDGERRSFSLKEIGLRVDTESSLAIARERQHTSSSRFKWWKPIPLDLVIEADHKVLETFLAAHASVVIEPAHDASLAIVDGSVQLTDEIAGKQYGLDNPIHTILEAASKLDAQPLLMKTVTLRPAVTVESLVQTKTQLDTMLKQPVVLTISGERIRPNSQDIAGWITLTPDQVKKTVTINVNSESVKTYINRVASDHNRPPRPQISLSSGNIIPGDNGVTVTNADGAVATIAQNLANGKGIEVDIPVKLIPFKTITASDSARWIEVDITYKRMYVYEHTNLVRTFLISAGAPATPTVTGTFAIFSKSTKQTMSGPNADGTRYVQPNVPWVSYFYRDYAIHGNYWRPTRYFGNINSSHGCVGLKTAEAAWLYKWASIGTPVIVHK